MSTPAKDRECKVQAFLTEEAFDMLEAMKRTTGSKTSPLVERAIRMLFLNDPLHRLAMAQTPLALPASASPAPPVAAKLARSRPASLPRRRALG